MHQGATAWEAISSRQSVQVCRPHWPEPQVAKRIRCSRAHRWRIEMAGITLHHPHGNDFDRFLYACVGEDRNGNVVTVLSALARLGFDPWRETSELGALSAGAARARLSSTLSRFQDVPALSLEHASIAQELTGLLPERSAPVVSKFLGSRASEKPPVSFGAVFAILMILLVLMRIFVPGVSGSGE